MASEAQIRMEEGKARQVGKNFLRNWAREEADLIFFKVYLVLSYFLFEKKIIKAFLKTNRRK